MQTGILLIIIVTVLGAVIEGSLVFGGGVYWGFDYQAFQQASEAARYTGNPLLLTIHSLKLVSVSGWRRWGLGAAFIALLLVDGVVANATGYVAYAEAQLLPCADGRTVCTIATPTTLPCARGSALCVRVTPTPTTTEPPGPAATVTATPQPTPRPVVTLRPIPAPTVTIQPTAIPVNDTITVTVQQNLSCTGCQTTGLTVWVDHITSTGGQVYVVGTITNTGPWSYTTVTCNGSQRPPQLYLPGSSGLTGSCGDKNGFPQINNDEHPVAFMVTFADVSLAHQQTDRFHFCLQMNNGTQTPPPFTMDFDDLTFTTS